MSKLHDAIRQLMFGGGDEAVNKIRELVRKQPKLLEQPDKNGDSPLFLASCMMRDEPVKLLIDLGADVKAENKGGWPIFMKAAADVTRDTLELMIKKGADPRVTVNGETALHRAMLNERNAVGNGTLLLEHGVDINARDSMGWSALDKAAMDNLVAAAEFLISKGAEVHHVDTRGLSSLDIAVERGYAEMAELLRKHGAKTTIVRGGAASFPGNSARPTA